VGFPLQVESLEDGVDDAIHGLDTHKTDHGPSPPPHFHEALDDAVGCAVYATGAGKKRRTTGTRADSAGVGSGPRNLHRHVRLAQLDIEPIASAETIRLWHHGRRLLIWITILTHVGDGHRLALR
jgi:hypothetical protein